MGWLIDEVVNELLLGLAREIHRTVGWIGCLIISLALITILALLIWLVGVSVA